MLVKTRETTFEHPEFQQLAQDLAVSSSRRLVLAVTLASGAWVLMLSLAKAGDISLEILPIGALIAVTFLTVNRLIDRYLIRAQAAWLVLFAATVTLAMLQFRSPEIPYLFALLPMMAVVMIGWQSALVTGLGLMGLLFLIHAQAGSAVISLGQIGLVAFGGLLAGLIGWSAVAPLLTMVEWTNYSYRMARENLEEARNQRLELRQVQEDLLLANKELNRLTGSLKLMTYKAEEARRVKEEFVANVSHELRTPLNMIIGYTNLIMRSPAAYGKRLPARLMADISSIQRNSQHLVGLVNDVLDLSQVDAGRMGLVRSWVPVKELIESAVAAVQPLFVTKDLYLEASPPEEDFEIYCDGTRIREVILNLLSNAGRFTDTGGVLVRAWREAENLLVSVQDSGPGISLADQQRIFEPFQQLDPMLHHRTGGSGLGLTISKRFVELHDGKMWLESQPGQGTTFYFRVPVGLNGGPVGLRAEAGRWINPSLEYSLRDRPNKAPRPENTARLVVVEEGEALQRMIERNLEKVEIIHALTMEAALQQASGGSFEAVLINRPVDSPAPEAPANLSPLTPLITCWVPGREEAARRLGVVQYLLKPVPQETLLSALDGLGSPEMSVLLVDDDPETLQLLARILSFARPGFRTIRASNGQDALRMMRERRPDAVLLDLVLPGMSGFDILKEKGEDPEINAIPVIVVSSTDPAGIPNLSNQFTVSRAGGFSSKEFLACLAAVSDCLNTYSPKLRPAQSGNLPA
jgi:signal transduction histidine kinase/CheY-like chemotaxis protein